MTKNWPTEKQTKNANGNGNSKSLENAEKTDPCKFEHATTIIRFNFSRTTSKQYFATIFSRK